MEVVGELVSTCTLRSSSHVTGSDARDDQMNRPPTSQPANSVGCSFVSLLRRLCQAI